MTPAWAYLLAAGVFEIVATTAFRYTGNFTRGVPTAIFVIAVIASFVALQRSLAGIPLGTAYAVWTGIGAAGTAILGFAWFDEPATTLRLVFLTLLIGSIIGLKLVST